MKPVKIITVGRSHENEIVLTDSKVSRHHCQLIKYDDGRCAVKDMGSSNGTFVNGQRISGMCMLNPQDTVTVGTTTLPWQSHLGAIGSSNGPKNNGNTTPLVAGIVVAVLVIVGLILFLVLSGKKEGSNTDSTAMNTLKVSYTPTIPVPADKPSTPSKNKKDSVAVNYDAWCGSWFDESGYFLLEIRYASENKLMGIYMYANGSRDDAGDNGDGNPVSGTMSADGKSAVVSFISSGRGGTGKLKLNMRSNGQISLKKISSEGEAFVPSSAILTKAKENKSNDTTPRKTMTI